MKRKRKKGMSTLTRVLLCSWCILMLVLTFFIIDWAMNLSEVEHYKDAGSVDAFAEVPDNAETTPMLKEENVEKEPEPTRAVIPQAQFVKEYPHTGEMTERIAYEDGVAYGLRYPKQEDEAVAEAVSRAAHMLLTEEMAALGEREGTEKILLIDYEDGETAGLYSVLFHVEKEIDGVKEAWAGQWLFNKKKGEVAETGTLFADRAYLYVGEQVNLLLAEGPEEAVEENEAVAGADNSEEGKAVAVPVKPDGPFQGTREEFSEYVLTADGAKFYYEYDGKRESIVVPYIALHTYMAVTVNGTVVAEEIRELDPDAPMIALTFDDGPHYQQTPRLLEILEENGARSTFFILGDRSHFSASNKKTVQMVAEAGHEIASHTYSHKNLATLSVEELTAEITKARENLYALTGEYPTFVRPPYGSYNDLVKEYSYAPLITWNLDSKDWDFRNAEKVVDHVLKEAGDGKIVLMHDIHSFTVKAAEVLIPALIERGYQIVTVRELFYYKNVELENGRVYHSSYN